MKHRDIIEKMTLEEKALLLSGKNEWQTWNLDKHNIPSLFCSDGPHGIRKQAGEGDHLGLNPSLPATCFPTAATVANSWDEKLGEEIGIALGGEARALGVDIVLAPGLNIKRSPLCGRNFEYFSEDPYLAGKMAAAYIRGIQSQGAAACPKHFAVNSQETRRMVMNSVIDERTLREIYLTAFEIAVKEGKAKAIMSSYNQINGVYANENTHLLREILRDEWEFNGIVITDWGGSNDHVEGVKAGSDLEMPAAGFDSPHALVEAVQKGVLKEEAIDECVDRILELSLTLPQNNESNKSKEVDLKAHHQLAKKAAEQSTVLLKNEEAILPLKAGTKVALVGDFAFDPRYQGAGSSLVNPTQVDNMVELISEYDLELAGYVRGYVRHGKEDEELENAAVNLAKHADVILYSFGLDEMSESEGVDRTHMRIKKNQIALLEKLVKVNTNIIGILGAGAPIEMPWEKHLKGILHGYLCGQAGAGAILDIIVGKVNPSGKICETYPVKYEDTPAYHYFPAKEKTSEYRESVYVGYRYYDTANKMVRYPFGFGMSYTEFQYSNLAVEKNGVEFDITNTGKVDGAEIAQLYIGLHDSGIFRPSKELKGFKKVFLKSGQTKHVRIEFDDKTFRFWNTKTSKWEVESGIYSIMIGTNVEEICLYGKIAVSGTTEIIPYKPEWMKSYYNADISHVPDGEFEQLLGTLIPEENWEGELTINDAICQMYYARSFLARAVYHILKKMKKKSERKGKPDLNILFIYNMPFRALAKMTGGRLNMEMAEGIVKIVNGHFIRGMHTVIRGCFKNRSVRKKYMLEIEKE